MALLAAIARDIAELVRAGYPEETARRIATGELPMDTASRMERARQQGFNPDDIEYHGTENYFTEFEPSLRGKMGPGVYTTPDPELAEIHAASGQIMPLLLRGDYISRADAFDMRPDVTGRDGQRILNETLREAGYSGTRAGSRGSLSPETVTFDPSNIRSYYSAAFDPEYTGPNILGGAALPFVGGLLAAGQSEDADAGFVTRGGKTLLEAWHGSPHKFDKFSIDQIGTGEGAQAYGHGLYFADSEDVARQYRDTLSLNGYQDNNTNYAKALELGLSAGEFDRFEGMVRMAATKDGLDTGRISKDLQEYLQWPDDSMPALESFVGEYLDTLPKGALYRTEIDVTPESLLDWDKPISEQSEAVRELAKYHNLERSQSGLKENTGAGLYQALGQRNAGADFDNSSLRGADRHANSVLEEAGIKGVRYLDGRSRAPNIVDKRNQALLKHYGGDIQKTVDHLVRLYHGPDKDDYAQQLIKEFEAGPSYNYVIFDDSLINIAERGAADPRLLGGTALGSAGILGAIAAGERDDTAMVAAPRSDTLQDITMGLRGVERRLKGSPASLLFPEGVVNYLEAVNRPYEDPTALTRAMALFDLL